MDMEILFTILLCVIAAVITLISLFFFAMRRQKSYEEVKQDEIKADLALSKELSSTPRSKTTARQYKPWTSRKKKSDEAPTDSSAHVIPDTSHVTPLEPIRVTDEITVDQPVAKITKKKRPQQSVTPSSSSVTVGHASFNVTMEAPVETTAVTVEAVPVEESIIKPSSSKQKKPNKSSVEQTTKHKQKKTGKKAGDTASFNDLSILLESSPLGDDQIQELVDMLLTRKDGGWQSANKSDDSVTNWKKRFTDIKEQCDDVQKEKSNLTATVKRQREEITHHQTELRQHKINFQQKIQQLNKEISQLKTRLQSQEDDVSVARATIKSNQQLQEEHNKLKHQLAAAVEKERQVKMELVTLQQSTTAINSNSNDSEHDSSRVKELEETIALQKHRHDSETIRLNERINRVEMEKKQFEDSVKQFEDSVKQLEADNAHKQQQLLEAHDSQEGVQKQLDSAKDSVARTEAQFNELQKRLDQLVNDNETDLLRDHLLHSQEELKQLKEKLIEMTSLHDMEKQSCQKAEEQLQQNVDELLSVRQQLQLKEQECAGLQQKEEGLNQQLLEKEDELTELQQQLQQKGEGLSGLQQQLQQKGEGLSEVQSQLNQKNTECQQLVQQLASVQEEIVRLKEDHSSKESNVDSALVTIHNEQLQKKDTEIVEVTEKNKQLKEKNSELERQVDSLEERVDQLLEQTVKQKEENQQIKDEAERSLKEQLATAERSSREQGSRQAISECKGFLLNLFPNIIVSDSQEFSGWKESFKTQIVSSVFSKLDELETVQSQLSDKEAQEAHFTEERQKLMETLEATKGMLEDLQEELESHDSELQQKLQDVNSKLEQEKVANRSLSQELQSQRDKSNSLTKQLQEATKDKTTVNDIKNKLENEIKKKQTMQEELTRSHEQIKLLEERLQVITVTKEDCLKKNEELTAQCKQLTDKLVTMTTTHRPVNESSV